MYMYCASDCLYRVAPILLQLYVQTVISDFRMDLISLKVESRYAIASSGALCVMIPGIPLMLMWPAGNLVSLQQVCIGVLGMSLN